MKIKKLEIVGFKSFVDRTVFNFDHDVTGVVGPNGCGKSNVVDAIKWVMGEQSAQRLRGKSMDDIIFNGSENRGPYGFAEVSVIFDNTDGLAPPEYNDYSEICVTRRLDREGHSGYFINKTPVRLMDITNLFLGTGVGKRAYSIIEQGRIGYIVTSKPEDRRSMIEEAAGVTKFKARKRAAERKMDQTRQNLLRVGDIVAELERNLSSLQRQAQKAERYKRYRAEIKDLELYIAAHKWLELLLGHNHLSAELSESQAKEEGVRSALRIKEAELEVERTNVEQISHSVERAQSLVFEKENEVRVLEGEISQHQERIRGLKQNEAMAERELDEIENQQKSLNEETAALKSQFTTLESDFEKAKNILEEQNQELENRKEMANEAEQAVHAVRQKLSEIQTQIAQAEAHIQSFQKREKEAHERLEKMETERESLQNYETDLTQKIQETSARLLGLKEGKSQTGEKREELASELEKYKHQIQASEKEVEGLRENLMEKRSRLRSLEELQERFEGLDVGVKAIMNHVSDSNTETSEEESLEQNQQPISGVVGLVADRVECEPQWTSALAAALGDQLQQVIVKDVNSAISLIDYLKGQEKGRASFIPHQPRVNPNSFGDQDLSGCQGVLGKLIEFVEVREEDQSLIDHLLSGVWVTETLEQSLEIFNQGVKFEALVTLSGEVIQHDGTLSGGVKENGATHVLEIKREIRELHDSVKELDQKLTVVLQNHGELRNAIATKQAALESTRSESHDAELAIVSAEKDVKSAEEEKTRLRDRIKSLQNEIAEYKSSLHTDQTDLEIAQKEVENAALEKNNVEKELQAALEVQEQKRAFMEEQSAAVTESKVKAVQAQEKLEHDRGTLQRISKSLEELESRKERLASDVNEGAKQQGEATAFILKAQEQLQFALSSVTRVGDDLKELRTQYDSAKQELGVFEGSLRELRHSVEELSGLVSTQSMQLQETSLEMKHLLEHIEGRHRVDIRICLQEFHARPLPDAATKSRVDELNRLIDRMGEINLTAIEEYEEKSERHQYLSGQKQDLEESLLKLEQAIRKMNRESRNLFKEAFEAVNERFKVIFPQMFRGGKAELRLTDPQNMLETGIDIVAQPPGKRLGSLELMSGGEKALTAVAMIFAIFQYKPSPFCLLDEVDAPLDEANVARFSDSIRQMTDRSQFIVITHSKRTMEFADVLYGVTMEEPGVSSVVSVELSGAKTKQKALEPQAQVVA